MALLAASDCYWTKSRTRAVHHLSCTEKKKMCHITALLLLLVLALALTSTAREVRKTRGLFQQSDDELLPLARRAKSSASTATRIGTSKLINREAIAAFLSRSIVSTVDSIEISEGVVGPYSSLSYEAEEAIVVHKSIHKLLHLIETSIRLTSNVSRMGADTMATVASAFLKTFGGIVDLSSQMLNRTANKMQSTSTLATYSTHTLSFRSESTAIVNRSLWNSSDPLVYRRASRNHHNSLHESVHSLTTDNRKHLKALRWKALNEKMALSISQLARLFALVSKVCAFGGEAAELMTAGIGDALQDSFRGLEILSSTSHSLFKRVLHIQPLFNSLAQKAVPIMELETGSDRSHTIKPTIRKSPLSNMKSAKVTAPSLFRNEEESQSYPSSHGKVGAKLRADKDSLRRKNELLNANARTHNHTTDDNSKGDSVPKAEPTIVENNFTNSRAPANKTADAMAGDDLRTLSLWSIIAKRLELFDQFGLPFLELRLFLALLFPLTIFISLRIVCRSPHVVHSLTMLSLLVALSFVARADRIERNRLIVRASVSTVDASLRASPSTSISDTPAVHWLNDAMRALWTARDSFPSAGAFAMFINEVYEEMLVEELSTSNLRVKRFSLGSTPPLVRRVSVSSTRNNSCALDVFRKAKSPLNSPNTGFEGSMWHIFLSSVAKSSLWDANDTAAELSSFLVQCDRLILDVDFTFLSKDIDVALSLRSDELRSSALPELGLALNEVYMNGSLRLNMELTTDFPFFGNATMSFIEVPTLDFSMKGIGGVDLSVIPFAFQHVNSSLYWIMQEYTHPQYTIVDMRHLLCSTCDVLPVKTIPEVLIDVGLKLGRNLNKLLSQTKQQTQRLWNSSKHKWILWKNPQPQNVSTLETVRE